MLVTVGCLYAHLFSPKNTCLFSYIFHIKPGNMELDITSVLMMQMTSNYHTNKILVGTMFSESLVKIERHDVT